MAKLSKRQKAIQEKLGDKKVLSVAEALELLKSLPETKFAQTVDAAVMLGIDPTKSDQTVRSAVVLPNGTGKSVRVAVFAQGKNAEAATAAGAERVGMEDLAEEMKKGDLNYDVVIASPDTMRIVGQLGQVLGPKGLMPNPKVGTVTADVETAVKNAKAGQVRYRADKAGIVHCAVGKINFETDALKQNLEALVADLKRVKPATSKGIYMKKLIISSTMGPGLVVDLSSLAA